MLTLIQSLFFYRMSKKKENCVEIICGWNTSCDKIRNSSSCSFCLFLVTEVFLIVYHVNSSVICLLYIFYISLGLTHHKSSFFIPFFHSISYINPTLNVTILLHFYFRRVSYTGNSPRLRPLLHLDKYIEFLLVRSVFS